MTPRPVDIALLVVDVLERMGIPYAIGGSVASTLYGKVRTTFDVDLIAQLRPEHIESFVHQLTNAFYVDEGSARDAIERGLSFNLIHLDSAFKVDVFIPQDRDFDRAQLRNAATKMIGTDPERSAKVLTAEEFIFAKLEWHRLGGEKSERQWRDIMGIIAIQGECLNKAYLETQAAGLMVTDLLQRALSASSNV